MDLEALAQIPDPNSPNETIPVKVWFTRHFEQGETYDQVYGVFRLSDDSEIDFPNLPHLSKEEIYETCANTRA